MTDEEREFHGLTRMEQLRIAEQRIAKLEAQLANQPNPATGEWTAESVREIGGHYSITQQRNQAIAEAHNEKVQTLTDALKRAEGAIRSEDHVKMGLALVVIRDRLAELAKVK